MKLIILFSLVAVAMGQTPTAGPTAAPTPDPLGPGQHYCGAKSNLKCEYYQTCETVTGQKEGMAGSDTDATDMSYCQDKGNYLCPKYSTLSGEGLIVNVAAGGCKPSEKCCQGTCCALFSQACMAREEGDFTYGWTAADAAKLKDGTYNSGGTAGGMNSFNARDVSRNEWSGPHVGAIENRPKMCMDATVYMNPTAGFKVIYLPVLGIAVGAISLMLVMSANNDGKTFGMIMVVLSILMQFSYYTPYAFMSMAIAVATAKGWGGGWFHWVVLFQFLLFWYFIGGESFIFRSPNSIKIGSSGNFISDFGSNTWSLQGGCTTYFNFFKYMGTSAGADGNMAPWSSGDRTAWGYCSVEWIGFQLFLAVTNLVVYLILMIKSVAQLVGGGGGGGGEFANTQLMNTGGKAGEQI